MLSLIATFQSQNTATGQATKMQAEATRELTKRLTQAEQRKGPQIPKGLQQTLDAEARKHREAVKKA